MKGKANAWTECGCPGGSFRGARLESRSCPGEFLLGPELDSAVPYDQPACPVGGGDGLRRGHRNVVLFGGSRDTWIWGSAS